MVSRELARRTANGKLDCDSTGQRFADKLQTPKLTITSLLRMLVRTMSSVFETTGHQEE